MPPGGIFFIYNNIIMDDEIKDNESFEEQAGDVEQPEDGVVQAGGEVYKPVNRFDASVVHHLSGMYQNWFLDYASYVILERAVPHIEDGLKPVQRRILHSMKRMDDGRYNKVANIVGLGQKDLLVDCQGNWGNILTGDRAAAPRYIEARLSKFALDVVFNPKTTEWQLSYDGRNVPVASGAGRGGYSRRPVVENTAPQLQRDMRRRRELPSRRAVHALSRLPHWRKHRRKQV